VEEANPLQAWKKLIKPSDIVGIKSNVWNPLPTPKELEAAIEKRVLDVGVPKKTSALMTGAYWIIKSFFPQQL
jgi:hypothetical protein